MDETKLDQFRKEYPQYSDMSDMELARALHQQFYSDMSWPQFAKDVGLVKLEQAPEVPQGTGAGDFALTLANGMALGIPGMVSENLAKRIGFQQQEHPILSGATSGVGGALTGGALARGAHGALARRAAANPHGFQIGPTVAQRAAQGARSAGGILGRFLTDPFTKSGGGTLAALELARRMGFFNE